MNSPEKQRQAARMFEARAYRAGLNPDSAAHAGKERALPLVLSLERLKAAGEDTFPQAQEAALAEVYNYETIDLEEAFRVRDLIRKAMPNENAKPSRNPETGLQEFAQCDAYNECSVDEVVVTGPRGSSRIPKPEVYGPPIPEPIDEIVVYPDRSGDGRGTFTPPVDINPFSHTGPFADFFNWLGDAIHTPDDQKVDSIRDTPTTIGELQGAYDRWTAILNLAGAGSLVASIPQVKVPGIGRVPLAGLRILAGQRRDEISEICEGRGLKNDCRPR